MLAERSATSSDHAYSFGPFRLLPRRKLLLEGETPVRLGGRALDILLALVEQAGEVVGKNELMARVWPNVTVDEVNLRVNVAALRKALGDGQPNRRYVMNNPGRGYCFVERIEHLEPTAPSIPPGNQEVAAHNLPPPLTRPIGRSDAISALVRLLSEHRLVTVVGPGGIGKTTVALATAETLLTAYPHGVRFVDLAPLNDPRLVPSAVAAALRLTSQAENIIAGLVAYLRDKQMLIVLDSCEHCIEVAASLAEQLISHSRRLHILATSREPLRAKGERVRRLQPLVSPPGDLTRLTAADALGFPAIQLFAERASASLNDFELTDADAPVVAQICRKLDGIALAIELAAAHASMFSMKELLARLDDRLQLLQGRRTALPRHRTLAAALDWSYEGLPEEERRILRRLSVFAGTFTLQSAKAVAVGDDIVAGVSNLLEKSLVSADVSGDIAQYRLLDTTRSYARQKSRAAGDLEETRRHHAVHMAQLFATADAESERRIPSDWLAVYGRYLDDVRSALDWSMTPGTDCELGVSLTASAVTLWIHLSLLDELQRRVEMALQQLGADAVNGERREMMLFSSLSYAMVYLYGPTPQGTQACRTALEIARKIGDYRNQERALLALWNGCFANGEVRHSLEIAEEFMAVAAKLAPADVLVAHRLLGSSYFYLGNATLAKQHMEIMVADYGATSHDAHMARFGFNQLASARGLLALHLCFLGYYDQAMRAARQAAAEAIDSKHVLTACAVLCTSCIPTTIYTGYLEEARRYVTMLFEQARGRGLKRWENFALGFDGILCLREGHLEQGLEKLSDCVAQADDRANTRYMFIFSEHALALGYARNPKAGLAAIQEVLDRLAGTGERWYFPELYRCRAQLLNMCGYPPTDVEPVFEQALSLADEMSALTWRLRTAREYVAFLQSQGRAGDAFSMLKRSYDLFTEGRDTPELASVREQLLVLGLHIGTEL
jgi:predicted ATPase